MHSTTHLILNNYLCSTFFFSDTPLPSEEINQEEQAPEEDDQISGSPTPPPVLSMVELFNQRRQKLIQKKLKIAELSNSILENPEGSVSTALQCSCSRLFFQVQYQIDVVVCPSHLFLAQTVNDL